MNTTQPTEAMIEIIKRIRDSIGAGGDAKNAAYERGIVGPYLDAIEDEIAALTTSEPAAQVERVRLFDLHGGRCHICEQKIKVGEKYDLDHIVAWELTRDDSDDNVKPAHQSCHKIKTVDDTRAIRKADRIRAKHIGAWPKSKAKIQSRGFDKARNV